MPGKYVKYIIALQKKQRQLQTVKVLAVALNKAKLIVGMRDYFVIGDVEGTRTTWYGVSIPKGSNILTVVNTRSQEVLWSKTFTEAESRIKKELA